MVPSTEEFHFASLCDDKASPLFLSKDAIKSKKVNERAHRTFCTYLKEKNYGDGNFEN